MAEIKQMKVYTVDDVWQVEETQSGDMFQYYACWANIIDIKVCIGIKHDTPLTKLEIVTMMRDAEIGVLALMKQHEKIMNNLSISNS